MSLHIFPKLAPYFNLKREGITNRMVLVCCRPRVPSPPVPSSRGRGDCSALLSGVPYPGRAGQ